MKNKKRYLHVGLLRNIILMMCLMVCNVFSAQAAEEQDNALKLEAGEDSEVQMPGSEMKFKVFLPVNYALDRKWPAVFFYHGMNGKPTTSPIKECVDRKDFIIVGMPYAAENEKPANQLEADAIVRKEQVSFHAIRDFMLKSAPIDEKRIYLGGISMGGWSASVLGENEMPNLAGMIILLAGRQGWGKAVKESFNIRGKPIYIGAGDTDPNYLPAIKAGEFYARYGATVTFETFMGRGHAMAKDPVRLRAWLDAQGRCRSQGFDEKARKQLEEKLKSQFDEAMAKQDVIERYNALRDIAADSRLGFCSRKPAEDVQNLLAVLKRSSPVKEEWLAEKSFYELAWQDTNIKTLQDLKAVRDSFKKFGLAYPLTFFGKLAAQYAERLSVTYDKALQSAPGNASTNSAGTALTPIYDSHPRPRVIKYKKP